MSGDLDMLGCVKCEEVNVTGGCDQGGGGSVGGGGGSVTHHQLRAALMSCSPNKPKGEGGGGVLSLEKGTN